MEALVLNENVIKLIHELLKTNEPTTISDLAINTDMSEKSVWSILNSISFKKILKGRGELVKKPNVGIYLDITPTQRESLNYQLGSEKDKNKHIKAREVLLHLVLSGEPKSIGDLSEIFLISIQEIKSILDFIEIYYMNDKISLVKKQRIGVFISGDELYIRQFAEGLVEGHFDANTLSCENFNLSESVLNNIHDLVNDIQRQFGKLTTNSEHYFKIQIAITYSRSLSDCNIADVYCEKIVPEEFVKLIRQYMGTLTKNDISFLWVKFTSNRFVSSKKTKVSAEVTSFAKELLMPVLSITDSHDHDDLVYNLSHHIEQAIDRSKQGIYVQNPELESIKSKYARFYSMVLTRISTLEQKFEISLNEDEISFIALYLCAIFEKNLARQQIMVLIVCDDGAAQRQMLELKITREFPQVKIKKICDSISLSRENADDYHLIITTIPVLLKPADHEKLVYISSQFNMLDSQKLETYIHKLTNEYLVSILSKDEEIDFKFFKGEYQSREELLSSVLQIAEQFQYTSREFTESVIARENRASTAIGKNIAIPHGNDTYIQRQAVFYVKNSNVIRWGNDEVDIVILLILKFTDVKQNIGFFTRLYAGMDEIDKLRAINSREDLEDFKNYLLGDHQNEYI